MKNNKILYSVSYEDKNGELDYLKFKSLEEAEEFAKKEWLWAIVVKEKKDKLKIIKEYKKI